MLLRLPDPGTWVREGVLGCPNPRTEHALAALARQGVRVLVNLHPTPHDPHRLTRYHLKEIHFPVADFRVPSLETLERGIAALRQAQATGTAAAVHCGGGLGRTGTLLACYLVHEEGLDAPEAVEQIRVLRPGSIETKAQAATVDAWAQALRDRSRPAGSLAATAQQQGLDVRTRSSPNR